VQLLLYATNEEAYAGPLMTQAAKRGKCMELLAQQGPDSTMDASGSAYMVGVLSLVDALLGIPMQDLLDQVRLSAAVKSVLLEQEGYLGQLLKLAIAVEEADFDRYEELLPALQIQFDEANQAHLAATRWSEQLSAT
jgi:c-di-GMP phosphodiesterase